MNRTQIALMARGLAQDKAAELTDRGWTLAKLKEQKTADLQALGIPLEIAEAINSEARPPIPEDTLISVLFANRFQCCVCRDASLPIIVHHIDEWANSRSHEKSNLAVLCLNHHEKAHSTSSLSQNLDQNKLRQFKNEWEDKVKRFDADTILDAMRLDYSTWNYMNELRIFELARGLGIKFATIEYYRHALAKGVVDVAGIPKPVTNEKLFYMYEGPSIIERYLYVSSVLSAVIARIGIINISDYLDRGVVGVSIVPGDFIFVQGAHTFSPIEKKTRGRGQMCSGVRRANNVEVRFVFDRWEASSSSAKTEWLSGTKNQGSLIHVKDVSRLDGNLVITGTVLGICSNTGDLKSRNYEQKWLEWRPKTRPRKPKIVQL